MKKIKTIFVIISSLLALNACSTISEGLSDSKRTGNDEFLVEKKAPLVLPPNFGELPEPGAKIKSNRVLTKEKNGLSIEEMMSQSSSTNTNNENNNLSKSIEKSIIEKINEQ